MTLRRIAVLAGLVLIPLAVFQPRADARTILQELKFPEYREARLVKELTLPMGLLDRIVDEFGDLLGIVSLRQVVINAYNLDKRADSAEILDSFDKVVEEQKWHARARVANPDGSAFLILSKETDGMLIVKIGALGEPGREMSLLRIDGTIDESRLSSIDPNKAGDRMAGLLKAGIPVDEPISVPPSDKLNFQSTRTDLSIRFGSRNTVMIESPGTLRAGDLTRTKDGRLLLELTPRLRPTEITAPAHVPLLLEPTDGRVSISAGRQQSDRPVRLTVIAVSSPVTLDTYPLISGTHSIQSTGDPVEIYLTEVSGGVLEVEVQRGDILLEIPSKASAVVSVSAISGEVHNMTSYEARPEAPDSAAITLGDGKARITLKTVKGDITVRFND